ncbi:MAG: hypothetical protein II972_00415 [Elusimicrobiaceae bacterium]|nr:hypothetical protein [Elusimicrobiaceae bacterium]
MWASMALMGVATAAEVASTIQQGKAQERAYNLQADIDEQNAERSAKEASLNEDTLRRQNRQKLAKIAGAQSEAGLSGGTATGSYLQSAMNAEQDALNLRYQGLSAWQNYKNNAAYNRAYAKISRKNALTSAYTQGLTGAAQILAFGGPKGAFGQTIASKFKGA